MKPLQHAKGTVGRHGGAWQDYIEIHNLIDSSKATFATTAHRALLHNELGLTLAVRIFGETIVNSDGATLSVAQIVQEHLEEDVGVVPTLDSWLAGLPEQPKTQRFRILPPKMQALASDPLPAAAVLFGGIPEDYRSVFAFFDLCNSMSADPRRDYFLHNSFGIWLAERTLGVALDITMAGGRKKEIATRQVGESLVQARMNGYIHPPVQLFGHLRIAPWMRGYEVADTMRKKHADAST